MKSILEDKDMKEFFKEGAHLPPKIPHRLTFQQQSARASLHDASIQILLAVENNNTEDLDRLMTYMLDTIQLYRNSEINALGDRLKEVFTMVRNVFGGGK